MSSPKQPKAPKLPRAKIAATPQSRKVRKKLEALIARPGTPDEGKAAQASLDRLLKRYDFTPPDVSKEGLFAGAFIPATTAAQVLECADWELMSSIKWAIESGTRIQCTLRGSVLMAAAEPATAERLHRIGHTIATSFDELWGRFKSFPTVGHADKPLFLRGIFDGVMDEERDEGERLPARILPKRKGRATKHAVGMPAGIAPHPYAVAIDLGRALRLQVPLDQVRKQLESARPLLPCQTL